MAKANDDGIDKVYEDLESDINKLLENETLSTKELIRGLIRNHRGQLPLFREVIVIKRRTDTMWAVFRPAVVVGTAALGAIMTFVGGILKGDWKVTR